METIYSDGKTLEIERMLGCTVFLPLSCYFCGEEIRKFGRESESLVFHSLDGDHDNWNPENKVPAHKGCHIAFHNADKKGRPRPDMMGDKNPSRHPDQRQRMRDKNPMKRPEVAAKIMGDKNPAKRPEVRVKISKALRGRKVPWSVGDKNPMRNPKVADKIRGDKNPNYGDKVSPEEWKIRQQKAWATRRAKYGPTGRKPKGDRRVSE